MQTFLFSPLNQFGIIPWFSIKIQKTFLDFTFLNSTLVLILILIGFVFLFSLTINIKKNEMSFNLYQNGWQLGLTYISTLVLSVIKDNIQSKTGSRFFPLLFVLFCYVFFFNAIGLIPFSFTITSHLIVTFTLSLFIFIGINIIACRIHGLKIFSLFLPSGTSFTLAFLLIPIELISYIFKPISLSIRLFANMMAGHTLLKVIVGFAFKFTGLVGVLFTLQFIPLLVLIPLFFIELGVAFIQSLVFIVLISIYINDVINLH